MSNAFQYIPCYGLSYIFHAIRGRRKAFQYIPCYGLSVNHGACISVVPQFQYIPCYGLSGFTRRHGAYNHISIHPMLRFIINVAERVKEQELFQYIPCYGLSAPSVKNSILNQVFQYIPCYGLSDEIRPIQYFQGHFNTSHVTVYLASVHCRGQI